MNGTTGEGERRGRGERRIMAELLTTPWMAKEDFLLQCAGVGTTAHQHTTQHKFDTWEQEWDRAAAATSGTLHSIRSHFVIDSYLDSYQEKCWSKQSLKEKILHHPNVTQPFFTFLYRSWAQRQGLLYHINNSTHTGLNSGPVTSDEDLINFSPVRRRWSLYLLHFPSCHCQLLIRASLNRTGAAPKKKRRRFTILTHCTSTNGCVLLLFMLHLICAYMVSGVLFYMLS